MPKSILNMALSNTVSCRAVPLTVAEEGAPEGALYRLRIAREDAGFVVYNGERKTLAVVTMDGGIVAASVDSLRAARRAMAKHFAAAAGLDTKALEAADMARTNAKRAASRQRRAQRRADAAAYRSLVLGAR